MNKLIPIFGFVCIVGIALFNCENEHIAPEKLLPPQHTWVAFEKSLEDFPLLNRANPSFLHTLPKGSKITLESVVRSLDEQQSLAAEPIPFYRFGPPTLAIVELSIEVVEKALSDPNAVRQWAEKMMLLATNLRQAGGLEAAWLALQVEQKLLDAYKKGWLDSSRLNELASQRMQEKEFFQLFSAEVVQVYRLLKAGQGQSDSPEQGSEYLTHYCAYWAHFLLSVKEARPTAVDLIHFIEEEMAVKEGSPKRVCNCLITTHSFSNDLVPLRFLLSFTQRYVEIQKSWGPVVWHEPQK
ncbi:MAG: hypothetical protein HOM34_01370 [Planctomycetes bacterium]|nr:hypothetical protein [Planctomycetota bacterium]MBT4029324.1 hypothetical protein [Planctomycetota bacterium]MBT4560809.1 hypothetical protein [Planctomycetota bacterium]MBT5101448.1 hypothetical protein [Planctomycetota bacterium]MBT5119351.1 hypothetical protein [Planctomycetota bacterium]